MKKTLIKIGSLVVVVALAIYIAYVLREKALDRADKEGYAAASAFVAKIGDGAIKPEQKPAVRDLLAKMEEISSRCRPDMRELLLLRRMDGFFLLSDFVAAEKLMDEYQGRSSFWREGAKAKIRAHAAIAKGDKKTAVAELETFVKMTRSDPEMEYEQDPSTDEEWSREMILARNYYRMSALAASYDKKVADGYLKAAKDWIEKAKKSAEGDKAMLSTIEKIPSLPL